MGTSCRKHATEMCMTFPQQKLKERDHQKDIRIDGMLLTPFIRRKMGKSGENFVNTVMNLFSFVKLLEI